MLIGPLPLAGPALHPSFCREAFLPAAALAFASVSGLALAIGGALPASTVPVPSEEAVVAESAAPPGDAGADESAYFPGLRVAQAAPPPASQGIGVPAGPGAVQPTGSQVPPANDPSPAEVSAAETRNQGQGFRFQFAPFRWAGNIGDTVSWNQFEDAPSRLRHFQTGNISGRSYLWQPWFLQFGANIGVTTGTESGGVSELPGADEGRDTTILGGADLLLFPASRFPFTASFSRTDSRTAATVAADDFVNTRISLRQDYVPLQTPVVYSLAIDRSELDGEVRGKDTIDGYRGSIAWRGSSQSLNLDASYYENRSASAATTEFDSANAAHSWRFSERLNMANLLTYTRSKSGSVGVGRAVEDTSSTLSLNSSLSWQPETERPLSVSGGLQYYKFGFSESESQSATAYASANYSYSQNISIYGSGQLGYVGALEDSDVVALGTAGIDFVSDPINLSGYNYTWNVTGQGTLESGGASQTVSTLTTTLGHSIYRSFDYGARSNIDLGFNQAISSIVATSTGNTVGFTNNFTGSWSFRQSEDFTMRLSFGASDSRFTGDSESAYTSFNAQLDGNLFIDRYSNVSAALTVQTSRQDTAQIAGAEDDFGTSIFGTIGYQHMRFLGVPRLRYTALYTGNTQEINSRAQGNFDAQPRNETHSLEQRLEYRIGRLEFLALARISQIEGSNNAFVFCSINRAFGAF